MRTEQIIERARSRDYIYLPGGQLLFPRLALAMSAARNKAFEKPHC